MAKVRMASGDPCKNAVIRVRQLAKNDEEEDFYTDTTGTVLCLYFSIWNLNDDGPADVIKYNVQAFMNADTNIDQHIWMYFIQLEKTYKGYPVTEIIFPDSLAIEQTNAQLFYINTPPPGHPSAILTHQ